MKPTNDTPLQMDAHTLMTAVAECVRLELLQQVQNNLPVAVALTACVNACVVKGDAGWWWLVGSGDDASHKGEARTPEDACSAAARAASVVAVQALAAQAMAS